MVSRARSKKISLNELARRKRLLSKIVKFGFKTRKRFNFGERMVIQRAWKKYRTELEHIYDRKIAVFVPAKRSQIQNLKNRFVVTNKGVIVYRPEGTRKPKIKGRGRSTTVTIELVSRTEIFIPYSPPPDFLTFAIDTLKNYKPEWIMLAVGKYKGTQRYDLTSALRYLERDISPVIEYYESMGVPHPYTGLYLIIKRKRKKVVK